MQDILTHAAAVAAGGDEEVEDDERDAGLTMSQAQELNEASNGFDAGVIAAAAVVSSGRSRGGLRVSRKRTYEQEIRRMFSVVTSDDDENGIDQDAVGVVDEILTRSFNACVDSMDAGADPKRSILRGDDLETTLRSKFLLTDQQEELVVVAKKARSAVN